MSLEEFRKKINEKPKTSFLDWFKHNSVILKLGAVIILIIVIIAIFSIMQPQADDNNPAACFKHDRCLDVVIAKTYNEQEIGLSNYTMLAENQSMLFIFEQPGKKAIWMKDMDFAIDIMWLDAKGRILHIVKDARPCMPPQCDVYEPGVQAKYVLETNSGFAIDTNLFDGDRVELRNIR
ncbi:DUF192 domain-containing protein [Candidatus Woesearchaeota archaeon]|nr:DUF192 domain-containing protein [Candidatus Woesearchaeota archaeon]